MSSTTGFRSRERPHSPPTDAETCRAMERRRAQDAANPFMTAPMRKANYPTAKPTGWDTCSAWRAPGGSRRASPERCSAPRRGPRLRAARRACSPTSRGRRATVRAGRAEAVAKAERAHGDASSTCSPTASRPGPRANRLRLWFAAMACAPLHAQRRIGPRPDPHRRRRGAKRLLSTLPFNNTETAPRQIAATPLPAPTTHDKQCSHASPPRRPW